MDIYIESSSRNLLCTAPERIRLRIERFPEQKNENTHYFIFDAPWADSIPFVETEQT